MSATTRVQPGRGRPDTLIAAVVITVIAAIASVATAPLVADDGPAVAVVISIVVAALSVVAAWGLWQRQRWGAISLFVISAFGGLSALPGFGSGSAVIEILVGVGLVEAIAVCWLILLESTRAALR